MSPVGDVISSIGVTHTQHADDTQLYVGHDSLWTMKCIKALHYWLDLNGLWLNPEKTEAVVLHKWKTAGWRPHWHNRHWSCPYQDTRQCEESGCRSSQRVNNTCRPVHFHNKALCQVRKLLPDAAAKTVTCAMVAGRFDYCDALCSPVWYFICECDHRFLSPATLISDNSAVSVLTSILKQPLPSLPLLSTLNLTTVTLSTTIFLNLK